MSTDDHTQSALSARDASAEPRGPDPASGEAPQPRVSVQVDAEGMTLWTPEGAYRTAWQPLLCDYPGFEYAQAFALLGGFGGGGTRLIEA